MNFEGRIDVEEKYMAGIGVIEEGGEALSHRGVAVGGLRPVVQGGEGHGAVHGQPGWRQRRAVVGAGHPAQLLWGTSVQAV